MNIDYAILYLEINILSIILVGIILHRTRGLSKMVSQQNFAMSIVSGIVFFAADTLYVLLNERVFEFGLGGAFDNAAKLMCKEIYFFATAAMCYFWFVYFELLRDTPFSREKKNLAIASSVMWLTAALLIVNLFTGFLFYVDENGIYHRGTFFILTYIFPYVYVFVACIRTIISMFDKNYTGDKRQLIPLTLFPLFPGAAGIMQFIWPRLPVACGVLALATLELYLNWTDQLISLDPLTGLNNRKQLIHYYERWVKFNNDDDLMYLLMIDANRFKQINDTYGHIQGDTALKNIAEALRLACRTLPKRANISRYGGDEFAIMFESSSPEYAEKLDKCIRETLDEVNKRSNIPFELTVSIGSASTDGSIAIKELIDLADEAMYEEKSAYAR